MLARVDSTKHQTHTLEQHVQHGRNVWLAKKELHQQHLSIVSVQIARLDTTKVQTRLKAHLVQNVPTANIKIQSIVHLANLTVTLGHTLMISKRCALYVPLASPKIKTTSRLAQAVAQVNTRMNTARHPASLTVMLVCTLIMPKPHVLNVY